MAARQGEPQLPTLLLLSRFRWQPDSFLLWISVNQTLGNLPRILPSARASWAGRRAAGEAEAQRRAATGPRSHSPARMEALTRRVPRRSLPGTPHPRSPCLPQAARPCRDTPRRGCRASRRSAPAQPRDERGIRPNLPPSRLARPSRNRIRPGRPALMSAEELRPLCLGGLEPQGGRLERAAAGAAFLGSPRGGEEAGQGVRRVQAPLAEARKRPVVGIQGPAGGCAACTTGCDAPSRRPPGRTVTVAPRCRWISGPTKCCSSCLKRASQLFLPGLRVGS